jgi:hypothetical protein
VHSKARNIETLFHKNYAATNPAEQACLLSSSVENLENQYRVLELSMMLGHVGVLIVD